MATTKTMTIMKTRTTTKTITMLTNLTMTVLTLTTLTITMLLTMTTTMMLLPVLSQSGCRRAWPPAWKINEEAQRGGQDDEEGSRKRLRWCVEDDWSSGIDTGSICGDHNNTDENAGNTAVEHAGARAEVADEDPLPGPSRKRSREHDEDKASSGKKLRLWYEFADSDRHNWTQSCSE